MDPVADMLVIIKNGYLVGKQEVFLPYSKFKLAIAKVLEKEGFIGKVEKEDTKISIKLLYENQNPKITQIKRVSKLGLRIYTRSKNIKDIKGGKGLVVVSTSQGVMNAKEAKSKNLGGEIICQLW